jgi:hypothetical protein
VPAEWALQPGAAVASLTAAQAGAAPIPLLIACRIPWIIPLAPLRR